MRDGEELVREERKRLILCEFSYYYAMMAQLLSRIWYSVGFRCSLETVCLRDRDRRQDRDKTMLSVKMIKHTFSTEVKTGSQEEKILFLCIKHR